MTSQSKKNLWRTCFAVILLGIVMSTPSIAGESADPTKAPQQSGIVRVVLTDGSQIMGRVESENDSMLFFRTLSGVEMTLPKRGVESLNPETEILPGSGIRRIDPNYTRLFFAPTARPLRHGQWYISVYELFFPFIAVGIGDRVTAAGGITMIPGSNEQAYYFAPKVTILNTTEGQVAAGVIYFNITGVSNNFSGAGIMYANATYGSPLAAVTVGAGWGFSGTYVSDKPVLMIGGEYQVSNSIKLITENWTLVGVNGAILTGGVRFFGDGIAADLGAMYPFDPSATEIINFIIPWVGFAYNFGGK